ncbi:hypothetical protein CSKR_106989 [Clonorchis sinensis]|uniref:Uncharacterized protein n=1 Tax=Clonorchis sinensis TaxID=79923 RepID=A0A419Q6C1_CLOSI|nr:hypothetical protein CSKR_106989 [Clonorchis sinensis]
MPLGHPHLDKKANRVWLKGPTAGEQCLAGNAKALPFLLGKSPHVPTPNLEEQETVFLTPPVIDQLGMKDSVHVAEVRKPTHHGGVQSLRNGLVKTIIKGSSGISEPLASNRRSSPGSSHLHHNLGITIFNHYAIPTVSLAQGPGWRGLAADGLAKQGEAP